jgi:hypothetical protein
VEETLEGGTVAAEAGVLLVAEVFGGDVSVAGDGEFDDPAGSGREGSVVLLCSFDGPGRIDLDVGGVFSEEVEQLPLEVAGGILDVHRDAQQVPP